MVFSSWVLLFFIEKGKRNVSLALGNYQFLLLHMFRRLRWFVGLSNKDWSTKRLLNVEQPSPTKANQFPLVDAVHEVAIYIHRFHNLDLFQQGWYKIKVTVRWEDDEHQGIPARVVQYDGPDLDSENICGVWNINDTDNSFSTPAFRIKYGRQDVLLSMMIAFNLSFGRHEIKKIELGEERDNEFNEYWIFDSFNFVQSSSGVILKFELMHAPISQVGNWPQVCIGAFPVSIHEYRIPPKALMGLHSYCPLHFDSFHAVLVDTTVHVSLLRSAFNTPRLKVPSEQAFRKAELVDLDGSNKVWSEVAFQNSKEATLIKALKSARDVLLEELKAIGKGINQAVDLAGITSYLDDTKFNASTHVENVDSSGAKETERLSGRSRNSLNKVGDVTKFQSEFFHNVSWDDLSDIFQTLGSQMSYLWNTFLNFHRTNRIKILELLCNVWANDRRSEWSIWMVYSKIEMPTQYMNYGMEGSSSFHSVRGRALTIRKMTDDPAQTVAMRAELHRRSIAQMRINNQSLQDMYIFRDPLRIPIVIIEHITSMPLRMASAQPCFRTLQKKVKLNSEGDTRITNNCPGSSPQCDGHVLKIVVFVHGFQGHHLDLRLVRNQWLLVDPKIQFLMSETNEEKTSEDFREMGLRLAHEVISFLKKKLDKASRSGNVKSIRLSFVGHSIGNIIIRAALAESIMEPYLQFLHTYLSISGPHLGYLYNSNSIFNSGLWLLKKLKGAPCIHQLTFTDDPDLRSTFLFNLSKLKTLEHFRNVILLSSPQDGYVPYHSARIELCPQACLDYSKRGKVFLEMLNCCLDQLQASSNDRVILRCDVNFDTSSQGTNFNTFIGRAAHIEFLESDIFASDLIDMAIQPIMAEKNSAWGSCICMEVLRDVVN